MSDLASAESLLEIHHVRRVLEPEATRLATPRLTEDDFQRLEDCLRADGDREQPVPAFIEADTAFHRVILDACGNATLASLVQNLSSGTLRARLWQSLVARGAVEATLASHRSIYNALVARDAARPPPLTSCTSRSPRSGCVVPRAGTRRRPDGADLRRVVRVRLQTARPCD